MMLGRGTRRRAERDRLALIGAQAVIRALSYELESLRAEQRSRVYVMRTRPVVAALMDMGEMLDAVDWRRPWR